MPESAIYALPDESRATPYGLFNNAFVAALPSPLLPALTLVPPTSVVMIPVAAVIYIVHS